jgi:hypothetical protein
MAIWQWYLLLCLPWFVIGDDSPGQCNSLLHATWEFWGQSLLNSLFEVQDKFLSTNGAGLNARITTRSQFFGGSDKPNKNCFPWQTNYRQVTIEFVNLPESFLFVSIRYMVLLVTVLTPCQVRCSKPSSLQLQGSLWPAQLFSHLKDWNVHICTTQHQYNIGL